MLQDALAEVGEYCLKNAWLNEIYQFCQEWSDESLGEFKGKAAYTIEVWKRMLD